MIGIGVLISGSGTNLQAILDAQHTGVLGGTVRIVVSNRPDVPGLARATVAGVPTRVIPHQAYATRGAFETELVAALRAAEVELVALAGFDRLVTRVLLDAFPDRVLNIHPALLPAFKGLHGQRQALEYGVRIAGATVHFVDPETDHGPIIIQGAVAVSSDDTEEVLRQRVLAVEHRIYPEAIRLVAGGRLSIVGRRVVRTGERPASIPPPLVW